MALFLGKEAKNSKESIDLCYSVQKKHIYIYIYIAETYASNDNDVLIIN